jgi:hypothetical protein
MRAHGAVNRIAYVGIGIRPEIYLVPEWRQGNVKIGVVFLGYVRMTILAGNMTFPARSYGIGI